MSLQRQSAAAERALLEIYYRDRGEELDRVYPHVLALLSYHMAGMEQGFAALQELRRFKLRVQIWGEKDLLPYYERTDLIHFTANDDWVWSDREVERKKHHLQQLFIPVLSFSLMSDILRFNDRRPFVRLILWALVSGIKVSALSIGVDSRHPVWGENAMNRAAPLLQHELNKQVQQLRGFGIQFLHPEQVGEWFQTSGGQVKKPIFTQDDVKRAYADRISEIRVPKGAIITPLARDVARDYKIRLIFE